MTSTSTVVKPAQIAYGPADSVPTGMLLMQGLQHVLANTVGWVVMVAVLATFSRSTDQLESILRMGMLVAGIGAVLQSLPRAAIGSGYFCPPLCGPAYAPASLMAGSGFGLATLFGMTLFAGIVEIVLAKLLPRLRPLFPPEVVGVIMLMVGVGLIPLAMPLLFGDRSVVADAFAATRGVSLLIGTFSLSIMVGLTIWGRGSWRFYPALAGMTGGWLFAAWLGAVQPAVWLDIAAKPWFALPVPQSLGIDFEWSLVPIFMIAAIASGVKGIGDLTVCQRANNLNWQRVDLQSASRGGMAFGVTNLLAGLFGTLGHGASSTNVGMSVATGVTSRQVAWAMGLMLGAIALMPKVASLFSHLPPPVMGAVMVYAAAFTTVAGIQILSSRLLDVRRILVVGLSVTFGLSPALLPELYVDAPSVLRPVLVSSVSLTVLVAVGLNALLRLGSAQSAIIDLRSGVDNHATIQAKFAAFGESVGARRDVVDWAAESVSHGFDALEGQAAAGMMQVSLRFTEFKLAVEMDYVGPPLVADGTRPDRDELLKSTDGVLRMAAFLVGRHAEKFEVEHLHGRTRVRLLFEH